MWPQIRGLVPFVVRGPSWHLATGITRAFDDLPRDQASRLAIAETLLGEGIVAAAWSNIEGNLPAPDRWEASVKHLARAEIPIPPCVCGSSWSQVLREVFQVISDLAHYKWYVSPDVIELDLLRPP